MGPRKVEGERDCFAAAAVYALPIRVWRWLLRSARGRHVPSKYERLGDFREVAGIEKIDMGLLTLALS